LAELQNLRNEASQLRASYSQGVGQLSHFCLRPAKTLLNPKASQVQFLRVFLCVQGQKGAGETADEGERVESLAGPTIGSDGEK
jgi:hypothetical protein